VVELIVGLGAEHCADLLDGLVLGLGHFLVGEQDEEGQDDGENDENVGTERLLDGQETQTDDKVGRPVGGGRDGRRHWPGRLGE